MTVSEGIDDDPLRLGLRSQYYGFAASVTSALQRVGECLANELVWVGQHILDGGGLRMIEVEHDMRQQHTVMPGGDNAHRGHLGHAGAAADIFGHPSVGCRPDLRGARFQLRSCSLLRLVDASQLVVGQDRDNDLGVDRAALVRNRCPRGGVLSQRGDDLRCSFEAQPFAEANTAVNDGTLKHLARCTDQVPSEPVQPAHVVQCSECAIDVGAVGSEDVVMLAPAMR